MSRIDEFVEYYRSFRTDDLELIKAGIELTGNTPEALDRSEAISIILKERAQTMTWDDAQEMLTEAIRSAAKDRWISMRLLDDIAGRAYHSRMDRAVIIARNREWREDDIALFSVSSSDGTKTYGVDLLTSDSCECEDRIGRFPIGAYWFKGCKHTLAMLLVLLRRKGSIQALVEYLKDASQEGGDNGARDFR